MKLNAIKKNENEIISPPKAGDIVDGKIICFEPNGVFVDLSILGIGIIYGREFQHSKDFLKNLKDGDEISVKITKLENEEGYRELSIREAFDKLNWEELKNKKEKEEILELTITKANRGGLLTQILGISAFLPASHLTKKHYPKLNGDNREIVKELQKLVGEKLKVKIIDVNQRENKLILSEKIKEKEETKEAIKKYKIADKVSGEITEVTSFGAFMRFGKEELEGLIYLSEISDKPIDDISEVLKVGQKIQARIIDISDDKICLSLKNV